MFTLLLYVATRGRIFGGLRTISTVHKSLLVTPAEVNSWPLGSYIPIDATWFMPSVKRDPSQEFRSKRIPSARFFNLDQVASQHELGLSHMIPSSQTFAEACESLAVSPDSHVVIYDTHGIFSAPRALFTFKAFGHKRASVLDGGLPRWQTEGFPIATEPPEALSKTTYPLPELDQAVIRSYTEMVNNSYIPRRDINNELVLDARTRGRFTGADPEPRPGLPSGHIPNSVSLPFSNLVESHLTTSPSYTTLLPPDKLRAAIITALGPYADEVLAGERGVVTSCGSGMTAAIIWLALQELGVSAALYDESWTGYAARSESKIATGED